LLRNIAEFEFWLRNSGLPWAVTEVNRGRVVLIIQYPVRKYGVSEATLYNWKAKFGGAERLLREFQRPDA
jgi:hypothetical protein